MPLKDVEHGSPEALPPRWIFAMLKERLRQLPGAA
jgi:hypothetical protein